MQSTKLLYPAWGAIFALTCNHGSSTSLTSGSCENRVGGSVQAELTVPTVRRIEALQWNPGDENWVATVSATDCLVQLYDLQYCSARASTVPARCFPHACATATGAHTDTLAHESRGRLPGRLWHPRTGCWAPER